MGRKKFFSGRKKDIRKFSINDMNIVMRTPYAGPPYENDHKEFHVNLEISESNFELFKRPLRDKSGKYLCKVGSLGAGIVGALFKISGIDTVTIEPYNITIHKGPAFEWEDIEPPILKILNEAWKRVHEELEEEANDEESVEESEEVNILPEDDKKELSENEED